MAIASEAETPKEEKPTFEVLPLSDEVRTAVAELGYVHPTPVQRAVFESAARGKDLVVQARTGTGKTAAFGLPLVDRLVRRKVKAVRQEARVQEHREARARLRQEVRVPVRRRRRQAEDAEAAVVASAATQDRLRPHPAPRI